MKRIVVRGCMKLQQHRIVAADDVWYRISSAQSYEHSVWCWTTVIYRQVILHDVALIPHPCEKHADFTWNSIHCLIYICLALVYIPSPYIVKTCPRKIIDDTLRLSDRFTRDLLSIDFVNIISIVNVPQHALTPVVLHDLVLNVYLVTVPLTNGK